MKSLVCYISVAILVSHSSFVNGLQGKQTSEVHKIQMNDVSTFHVSIQNMDGKHICSGAILNKEVILTVASSLNDFSTSDIKIVTTHPANNQYTAKELKIHPRYKTSRKDYNIALIILNEELPSDQQLNLKLPSANFVAKPIATGTLITYDHNQGKVETTQYYIGSLSKCKNSYAPSFIYITDRMFCAELYNKKTCQSDFGGLFIMSDTLAGILSWEAECGSTRYPSVFTNVGSYKKWIEEVL